MIKEKLRYRVTCVTCEASNEQEERRIASFVLYDDALAFAVAQFAARTGEGEGFYVYVCDIEQGAMVAALLEYRRCMTI